MVWGPEARSSGLRRKKEMIAPLNTRAQALAYTPAGQREQRPVNGPEEDTNGTKTNWDAYYSKGAVVPRRVKAASSGQARRSCISPGQKEGESRTERLSREVIMRGGISRSSLTLNTLVLCGHLALVRSSPTSKAGQRTKTAFDGHYMDLPVGRSGFQLRRRLRFNNTGRPAPRRARDFSPGFAGASAEQAGLLPA